MGKYFGTDGFRGEAGIGLTAEQAFKVGRYLGNYLRNGDARQAEKKPRAVIGKDTRLSSYMLEYAIASGLASSGVDVYLLHVTTTPSVSYVTKREGFDLGVMITASHNPFTDNGIKIIDAQGCKLSDAITDGIEDYLDSEKDTLPFAKGADIGRICDHYAGRNGYVGHLIALAKGSYKGLRIGTDAANGSAFAIARSVFAALGAEVRSIGDEPDGMNVNYECGSTHPERLARLVKEHRLDVGFAFDGDADRCIAIDENGNVVDGDAILYILSRSLKSKDALNNNAIALTVMSNSGLIKSLSDCGIRAEITPVGDRFVWERMESQGLSLGGEQSGHIIISSLASTGDGILTALMLTEEIVASGLTLSELYRELTVLPQINESVRVRNKQAVTSDREIKELIDKLGDEVRNGRILIRESGTEPKIRITVETSNERKCREISSKIIDTIRKRGYIDE